MSYSAHPYREHGFSSGSFTHCGVRDSGLLAPEPGRLPVVRRNHPIIESWPTAAEAAAWAGRRVSDSERWAANQRRRNRLFGVWSTSQNVFRYPHFQFMPCGRLHPDLRRLLDALAENPAWAPSVDKNGSQRARWLHLPNGSLSRAALAWAENPERLKNLSTDEARAALLAIMLDPVLQDEMPRSPAAVFAEAPSSVIAVACAEATDTDPFGLAHGADRGN